MMNEAEIDAARGDRGGNVTAVKNGFGSPPSSANFDAPRRGDEVRLVRCLPLSSGLSVEVVE